MDFITMLRQKQRERNISREELADLLGVHKSWINNKFSKNPVMYPLREKNMIKFHEILDIPYEVMDAYNDSILKDRGDY